MLTCPCPKCQARLLYTRLAVAISGLASVDDEVLDAVAKFGRKGVA